MSNNQKQTFIQNDRKFIDSYYYYSKYKKFLSSAEDKSTHEIQKALEKSCYHYLSAIHQCLKQIANNKDHNERLEYLDFIRWNYLLINTQLDQYQENAQLVESVSDLKEAILILKRLLPSIKHEYFELSIPEKGICNEYIHAIEIVKNDNGLSNTKSKLINIQAGVLFINYIDILVKKYCMEKLDRENFTFEDLNEEADFLMSKLKGIREYQCHKLSMVISSCMKAYNNFRESDEECRVAQDIVIANAIKMAHKRATENALERASRVLQDIIARIEEALLRGLEKVFDAGKLIIAPILHPIQAAQNLWSFAKHPVKSAEAIYQWAKKHPYKAVILSICGVGIVLSGVFGIVGVAGITTTIVGASIIGYGSLVLTRSAGKGGELRLAADAKIEAENNKLKALNDENEAEGNSLSSEARFAELTRQRLIEAKLQAEQEAKLLVEIEENQKKLLQSEISNKSHEELEKFKSEYQELFNETNNNLQITKTELKHIKKDFMQNQLDNSIVREGRQAALRITQRNAKYNSFNEKLIENEIKGNCLSGSD